MTRKSIQQPFRLLKVSIGVAMGMIVASTGYGGQSAMASGVPAPAAMQNAIEAVKGTVVDQNGEPVIGATVLVRGSNVGTVSDSEGHFSIKVPANSTLEVSFIGYERRDVKVRSGQADYKIQLSENSRDLDEVVVVGYGQQKKVNLTGSVSAIDVNKIAESRPISNVSQALAGLAPGVSVVSSSNKPGEDNATIRVRGQGTLNDSSPLVIIDGIEASLGTISPDDIESMSILKDAASSAIYGSRAANGVVLVTTKKGSTGSLKVNYNGYVSFESIRKTLTPVSNYADYMTYLNEGYEQAGYAKPFSETVIQEWRDNPNDPIKYPNSDWIKETFRSAVATNHNLSMSGGNEKYRFYTSFGFLDNPGVMPNSGFKKYSSRINVEADVKPWLSMGVNFNGYVNDKEPGSTTAVFDYAKATTPGMVFIAPDGRYGGVNNAEDDSQASANNPYVKTHNTIGGTRGNYARTRFQATLRPFKGFSLTGSYTYAFADSRSESKPQFVQTWNFKDDYINYDSTRKTSVSVSSSQSQRYFNDLVARYKVGLFQKLDLNVMAGMSHELYRSKSLSASRQDLIDIDLFALSACTGDTNASGNTSEWSMTSYFGRLNLNWADKYLAEFNLRVDGSSRFLKGHRWGYFPSGSIGWRMEQEAFMESLVDKGLSNLKIRASYGSLGNNAIGNYEAQATYALHSYVLNGTKAPGMCIDALANPNLTWETTHVANVGIDLGMFNNKLNFTAEYFHKRTENILISLPAPEVHGDASLPKVNSARVVNEGIELSASWNHHINDFRYGVSANFTYVHNMVTKFKGTGEDGRTISSHKLTWEGHPIDCHYLLKVDRILQTDEDMQIVNDMIANAPLDANGNKVNPFAVFGTPKKGDFLYKDVNGDGIINNADRTIVSDGTNPKYLIGVNLNASWKGIDFNMLIQSRLGGYHYFVEDGYNTSNVRYGYQLNKKVAEGAWREGRTDATYPRLLEYENTINKQPSDFYLSKRDYLKIRNIQLGYTLPKKWVKACGLSRVRVYGTLENFITFTGFKGFDPEVNGMGYPTMKQASLGLNLSF